MADPASIYSIVESDSLAWSEQAEGAFMSAEVIFPRFMEARAQHPSLPGIREQQLAFMHSFMLLTALAFEGVIKGLAVAQGIDWQTLREDGGHGLSQYVRRVTTVSDAELDLLIRLQEYLKWAGRYVVPMTATRYVEGAERRKWKSPDRELIPTFFQRLRSELHSHAARTA